MLQCCGGHLPLFWKPFLPASLQEVKVNFLHKYYLYFQTFIIFITESEHWNTPQPLKTIIEYIFRIRTLSVLGETLVPSCPHLQFTHCGLVLPVGPSVRVSRSWLFKLYCTWLPIGCSQLGHGANTVTTSHHHQPGTFQSSITVSQYCYKEPPGHPNTQTRTHHIINYQLHREHAYLFYN